MKHWHDEVRIEAPVEHVWRFFFDTSHWRDWMPRGEFSDFSGPLDHVGTTYVETMKLMGFEMKMTSEVVEVVPLRLYREHSDSGPMDTTARFEPDGEGTRLIMEMDYEMPGKVPGFIKDLFAKGWGDRQGHKMVQDFKALAEAKVPAHA